METQTIKKFYRQLTARGMAKLMSAKRNVAYLQFLKLHLNKKQKILDLACGYGRLTFPLFKLGYDVEGIDLAPNFIKDARINAKQQKTDIKFRVGNMLDLPYKDNSFDAIICMWSSFNHLLDVKSQIKALNEMQRILKLNGIAIIDMPSNKVVNGRHIVKGNIGGFENTDFIHNKSSIAKVLSASKVRRYKVKVEKIGERDRLIAYLLK